MISNLALLILCVEFEIFFGPNAFIGSVLNVLIVNFFKNVSRFLPNPGLRSIQVKKCLFSKFGIFILVSYCSPIILASFKSKISNVFCPAIFWHFRNVCEEILLLILQEREENSRVFTRLPDFIASQKVVLSFLANSHKCNYFK